MSLFTISQERYYNNSANFTGTGSQTVFTLTTSMFSPLPSVIGEFEIFVDGKEISQGNYSYSSPTITFSSNTNNTDVLESDGAPKTGLGITIVQVNAIEKLGSYQHITLADVVNNFMVSYVGEDKIIAKIKRSNVLFFAQRAIQELTYDTLESEKSQEIEIPDSLQMKLPHDYVNYIKMTWVDNSGVEHTILPAQKTSNPTALLQDNNFDYVFDNNGNLLTAGESETWKKFKDNTVAEDARDSFYLDNNSTFRALHGQRYGIDSRFMNANGSFFIDKVKGKIFFSSDLTGKVITLKYISDGVATAEEKIIHKFAEEAMYKSIAHAILATRNNVPEYLVNRFKKEKFAAVRTAKLRISNLKLENITQALRGQSKWIKH
jgi:hypothetical protein